MTLILRGLSSSLSFKITLCDILEGLGSLNCLVCNIGLVILFLLLKTTQSLIK